MDIGVHQDGLVHLSELSDSFVTDPASVVKAGDRLQLTVIGVDLARGRISLSAKSKPDFATRGGSSAMSPKAPRRDYSTSGFSINPFAGL